MGSKQRGTEQVIKCSPWRRQNRGEIWRHDPHLRASTYRWKKCLHFTSDLTSIASSGDQAGTPPPIGNELQSTGHLPLSVFTVSENLTELQDLGDLGDSQILRLLETSEGATVPQCRLPRPVQCEEKAIPFFILLSYLCVQNIQGSHKHRSCLLTVELKNLYILGSHDIVL